MLWGYHVIFVFSLLFLLSKSNSLRQTIFLVFLFFFFFPFLLILLSVWLQIEADVYNDTEKGIIMDRKYFSSVRILFTGELFALHAVYGILIGEVRPSAASFNFMFM